MAAIKSRTTKTNSKEKVLYDVIYKDAISGKEYSAFDYLLKMTKGSWDDEECETPWAVMEKQLKANRQEVLQDVEHTKTWFDAEDYDLVKVIYE